MDASCGGWEEAHLGNEDCDEHCSEEVRDDLEQIGWDGKHGESEEESQVIYYGAPDGRPAQTLETANRTTTRTPSMLS